MLDRGNGIWENPFIGFREQSSHDSGGQGGRQYSGHRRVRQVGHLRTSSCGTCTLNLSQDKLCHNCNTLSFPLTSTLPTYFLIILMIWPLIFPCISLRRTAGRCQSCLASWETSHWRHTPIWRQRTTLTSFLTESVSPCTTPETRACSRRARKWLYLMSSF